MTSKQRAIAALVPALVLILVTLALSLLSSRSPSRLTLELAWSAPTAERPLEAGTPASTSSASSPTPPSAPFSSALVSLFGFVVGTPLGAAAGLRGGAPERWTLRACDLVQSFPSFLLALAVLSAVRTPSRLHIGLVFCLTAWAPYARVAAAQSRVLGDSQFVEAARALGLGPFRVLVQHVLPNLLGPVTIQIGTGAAGVVLGETALGFVGLGPPDGVSLGGLLEQGTLAMLRAPHVLAVGALAVLLVSGSLQLASEGLRRWVHVD